MTLEAMPKKQSIPAAMREQLSQAGKKCLELHGREFYQQIGKKGWLARLEKARNKARELEKAK